MSDPTERVMAQIDAATERETRREQDARWSDDATGGRGTTEPEEDTIDERFALADDAAELDEYWDTDEDDR